MKPKLPKQELGKVGGEVQRLQTTFVVHMLCIDRSWIMHWQGGIAFILKSGEELVAYRSVRVKACGRNLNILRENEIYNAQCNGWNLKF